MKEIKELLSRGNLLHWVPTTILFAVDQDDLLTAGAVDKVQL